MNRTHLTSLLAFVLIILGLVTRQSALLTLSLPVLLYLLVGLWRGPEKLDLYAQRTMSSERALGGDEITVTLSITNRGKGIDELMVEDLLPAGLEVVSDETRHITSLPEGETVSWSYTLKGRRGSYALNQVQVTGRDHTGLFLVKDILPCNGRLFILPPVMHLRHVTIRPRRTRVYSGTIPARLGGAGVEFFGVRDYQQGDLPRMINWRATARDPGSIYSNEFEQERVADVGIILDGRRFTNVFGHRSLFEHSVMAAAAVANAFINSGNRVGLLFHGSQMAWVMSGYGKLQNERILTSLSNFRESDWTTIKSISVPLNAFPAGSQLVLISSLVSTDLRSLTEMRLRGHPLLIISPNPVLFEYEGLTKTKEALLAKRIIEMQRTLLLKRLRGLGIKVVDWDVSVPFEQVARRNLERYPAQGRGVLP